MRYKGTAKAASEIASELSECRTFWRGRRRDEPNT